MNSQAVIGSSIARIDAQGKVAGKAVYANDLNIHNMIYGKVLRGPFPRARIIKIDITKTESLSGITVLTHQDIPGRNATGPMIADQPILAAKEINFYGEAVMIVGADSEERAEETLDFIKVDYEPLEAVLDSQAALEEGAPEIHAGGNLAGHIKIRKGDTEKGFQAADIIIEGIYKTQRVEHAYLEPEAAVAKTEEDGSISVWTCTQYTHFDRRAIAAMLGISQNRVRIIQTVTGGGFGGKIWSLCPCYAALLAFKTGRPAKVIYNREESVLSTTKRHPYVIKYKTGATKEGSVQAIEVTMTSDTGPYMVVGKGVLARSVIQVSGPYDIPNVKIDGFVIYTNNSSCGAMRGYGGPQGALAHERQMDELARQLNMDPIELRKKNILKVGSATATDQILENSVGTQKVLQELQDVVESIRMQPYQERLFKKRGIGVGLSFHGIGSTRGGSQGTAFVNLLLDGSASVICGSVDVGQGSDTIMAQIAAAELGVSTGKIRVMTTDSDVTPDCESSSGSRVTYISGKAVQLAARNAKAVLFEKASAHLAAKPEELSLKDGIIFVKGKPKKKATIAQILKEHYMQGVSGVGSFIPRTVALDPECGLGSPCGTYSFAGGVAEVEVDTETGQVNLLKMVNIVDVGRAINPMSVEGQIEGGTSMGIGYAVMEEIQTRNGVIQNPSFTDYKIPTAVDIKHIEARVVEEREPSGPFDAKGFSEVTVTPVAAAILNAIRDATGLRISEIPVNSESVLKKMREN
ncbi:xanthine dehydrogenase family protein molybdopterin-binding subunit [Thermodesulfobacteriota bacterium]